MIPKLVHVDESFEMGPWNEAEVAKIDGLSGERPEEPLIGRIEPPENNPFRAPGALSDDNAIRHLLRFAEQRCDILGAIIAVAVHDEDVIIDRQLMNVHQPHGDCSLMSKVAREP
jgi:hypothetical protein